MSGFDLGTEIDRLKKRAIKTQVEYLLFCQENGISRNHMPPKMNENYTEIIGNPVTNLELKVL